MSDLIRQFGSPELALAAYNAGPAPVEACHCIPAIPETQAYVTRILALLGGAGALAVPSLRSEVGEVSTAGTSAPLRPDPASHTLIHHKVYTFPHDPHQYRDR